MCRRILSFMDTLSLSLYNVACCIENVWWKHCERLARINFQIEMQ